MRFSGLLLFALLGWTAIGLVGTLISRRRGLRPKALRGATTLFAVWAIYLGVLFTVSARQPARVVPPGYSECFDAMCFAVQTVDDLPAYAGRGQVGGRLIRVTVQVRNTGSDGLRAEQPLRAYVVDGQGHRWYPLRGLGGVPLTAAVPAGGAILSTPVYAVPRTTGPLFLVLTHGPWSTRRLRIGDGESLAHRRVLLALSR